MRITDIITETAGRAGLAPSFVNRTIKKQGNWMMTTKGVVVMSDPWHSG